jgi:hypothetical protein
MSGDRLSCVNAQKMAENIAIVTFGLQLSTAQYDRLMKKVKKL